MRDHGTCYASPESEFIVPPDEAAPPEIAPEPEFSRVTSVAVLIAVGAAVLAGATIWLVLTDPVTVASAVESGEVTPLVRRIAEVIYSALSGLLGYL
jgi:hypothetical protein